MKPASWSVFLCLLFVFFLQAGAFGAQSLPHQPTDKTDPGSSYYPYEAVRDVVQVEGRTLIFYGPRTARGEKSPVIVFGHGHTVPALAYEGTFLHLARKGIVVLYPQYDTGWRDKDFERMAKDYVTLVQFGLNRYAQYVDPTKVIFSGHSNGAFVALLAAGFAGPNSTLPQAVLTFESAGYLTPLLKNINPNIPVTLVVGDQDTSTPPSFTQKLYDSLTVVHKQAILLRSYVQTSPKIVADHGLPRTVGWTGSSLTPLHYFGTWKFLVAAAWDLAGGNRVTNPYLYGSRASSTGISGFEHVVKRNWSVDSWAGH